jgi:RNA polymerase sigma-70 factor, ECF subfamily
MSRSVARADRDPGFERLFAEYSQPIYLYVLRMVGGDPDRAADIAQDTFIKAYRKLGSLTDATSTRAWIYRIATNTAIDDMRRRRFVTRMDPDEPGHDRPDHRPGPEDQVIGAAIDERIQRALSRLRPNHRQCLILSDIEDMGAQQIGEVMGISYAATRTLLCRARGEMRHELAKEGIGA